MSYREILTKKLGEADLKQKEEETKAQVKARFTAAVKAASAEYRETLSPAAREEYDRRRAYAAAHPPLKKKLKDMYGATFTKKGIHELKARSSTRGELEQLAQVAAGVAGDRHSALNDPGRLITKGPNKGQSYVSTGKAPQKKVVGRGIVTAVAVASSAEGRKKNWDISSVSGQVLKGRRKVHKAPNVPGSKEATTIEQPGKKGTKTFKTTSSKGKVTTHYMIGNRFVTKAAYEKYVPPVKLEVVPSVKLNMVSSSSS
jgi:hypothetical protein